MTKPTHMSLKKMLILEENFKQHLEAFVSELFNCKLFPLWSHWIQTCLLFLYRYRVAQKPPLHAEFLEAIKSLPASYNLDSYRNLITTYGTHYTTSVKLGGQMSAPIALWAACWHTAPLRFGHPVFESWPEDLSRTHPPLSFPLPFQSYLICPITIKRQKVGGQMKTVTTIKSCQAAVSGLTNTAVKDSLDVEASGSYSVATVKAEAHFY